MQRTFRQLAIGYGATPVQVTVKIDNNVVYTGSVTTLDEPFPMLPNSEFDVTNVAWSWADDNPDFDGTRAYEISVTGSPLLLTKTQANNPYNKLDRPEVENFSDPFYFGEINGQRHYDPLTEEALDGVPLTGKNLLDKNAQWWWTIPPGSTFTALLHMDPAITIHEDAVFTDFDGNPIPPPQWPE